MENNGFPWRETVIRVRGFLHQDLSAFMDHDQLHTCTLKILVKYRFLAFLIEFCQPKTQHMALYGYSCKIGISNSEVCTSNVNSIQPVDVQY